MASAVIVDHHEYQVFNEKLLGLSPAVRRVLLLYAATQALTYVSGASPIRLHKLGYLPRHESLDSRCRVVGRNDRLCSWAQWLASRCEVRRMVSGQ